MENSPTLRELHWNSLELLKKKKFKNTAGSQQKHIGHPPVIFCRRRILTRKGSICMPWYGRTNKEERSPVIMIPWMHAIPMGGIPGIATSTIAAEAAGTPKTLVGGHRSKSCCGNQQSAKKLGGAFLKDGHDSPHA
jgi:hypothetical protein